MSETVETHTVKKNGKVVEVTLDQKNISANCNKIKTFFKKDDNYMFKDILTAN